MSLMQIALYDALKAGGTPEAEARHAAIEAAGSTSLLGTLAERINGLERLVLWMGGVIGFVGDLRRQMRDDHKSHARMLDDHGKAMTANSRAFQQMLADHRAALPTPTANEEGR